MKIRVVTPPTTGEKLDAWYREHGEGSVPKPRDAAEGRGSEYVYDKRNRRTMPGQHNPR